MNPSTHSMQTLPNQPGPVLIIKDHRGISSSAQIQCEPGDRDTLRLAVDTYGFLISRNESLTLEAFAQRIAAHYDCTLPRNAEVVAALRRTHTLNLTTPAKTLDAVGG